MFGRMSFLQGDPDRLDDLIAYARTVVKPATDQLGGNCGLGMWVNRDSGDAMVMTVWQDEACLDASERAVEKLRDEAAGIIGGDPATVERYETMLVDVTIPHQVGFGMRLVRMFSEPAQLDANTAWVRDTVLPQLRTFPGYVSYVASANRSSGAVATMATYQDFASTVASFAGTAGIRAAATERGVTIRDITNYEVAIVGIRAPIPDQRVIDLTETQVSALNS